MFLRTRLPLLAALALVGAPGPVSAQDIGFPVRAVTQDTARAQTRPTAIEVADVPIRADRAMSRLRGLRPQIATDAGVRDVERRLPGELEAVANAHDRLGNLVLDRLNLRELRDVRQEWRRYESGLLGWKATLEQQWQELRNAYETVAEIETTWKLTRDASRTELQPSSPIFERIESVIAAAAEVGSQTREQMESLLGLDAQIDEALGGVQSVLREIADAEQSVRARILVRNAAPLWEPSAWTTPISSEALRGLWSAERDGFGQLVEQDTDRVVLHFLLLFLVIAVAARLRARIEVEAVADDETLRAAAETLSHPVSAGLLLAILIAEPLYPRASFTVQQTLALLAIIPLYRLLPQSRLDLVNRALRALLLLVLVDGAAALLLVGSNEYRLLNLAIAIAITAFALQLVRAYAPAEGSATGWGRVVFIGLKFAIGVGALAVLANILGWSLLSYTLKTGLLGAAYTGLGTIIAYRVLAGMVRLLPYSAVASKSLALGQYGDVITSTLVRVLRFVAFPTWIWLTFQYLEFDDPVAGWLSRAWGSSLQVGILHISVGSILNFGIAVLLTVWVARLVRFFLDVEVLPRLTLERGVASAISTVSHWTILGIGLLAAAGAAGLGASQLALVAGALGVGIGFGLQNIVNNFVSGLILIFEQPIKIGDKVEITSLALTGEVRRIGIRASVVRSFDGAEVIVPNANLISSEVVNWTLSDQRRRVHTEVGVAYGTDPHRVIEILRRVADSHPEVLRYPEPQVMFLGFGDSSLNFRLLSWTGTFDEYLRLRSELAVATHDALKEAGIVIPFPQRDLHLKSVPADAGLLHTSGAGEGTAPPAD